MTSNIPPREELERLTRVVLLRMAKEHEIRGRSAMRKAELIDALDAHAANQREEGPSPVDARHDLVVEFIQPDQGTEATDAQEVPDSSPEAWLEDDLSEFFVDVVRVVDEAGPPPPQAVDEPSASPASVSPGRVGRRGLMPIAVGSLYLKDDRPMPLPGAWAFALLVAYIVLNRVISDRFVLPFGASIRVYEVILVLVGFAWITWMVVEPHPMPFGLPAVTGLALVVLVGVAPFLHGPTLDQYQANGAERGLFRMFIFVALFLTAYHIAFRLRRGLTLLGIIVATTVVQAGFAIYEKLTEAPVEFLDALANSIGLIDDPLSVRPDEVGGVFTRLSGDVRAVATAPHPIVLSSVIAVGILLAGLWLLYAKTTRTKVLLAAAGAVMVIGLPMANSRTGFVILGILFIPLTLLVVDRLPTMIMWSLPLIVVLGIAFFLTPETPRLLLNSLTDPTEDRNTVVRLERFERIPDLLEERPFVGAGYLTHDPQIQFFDNAYNLALIELGMFGLAIVVSFFLVSLARSWAASGRASPGEAILPIAGVVGSMALLAGGTTFDAWTFDQFFPTCLILMGLGLGRAAVIMRRGIPDQIMVVSREEATVR